MQYYFKRLTMIAAALAASLAVLGGGKAVAQQECMIGEVKMFAGNFAPRNYAFANGQLLPISQNQSLFSILGTTYGGDGRTTFALPDLRGRVSISAGQGPGLSSYRLGQKGGAQSVSQTVLQLAAHSHPATTTSNTTSTLMASSSNADSADPAGRVLANGVNDRVYLNDASPGVTMGGGAVDSTTNSSTNVSNTGAGQAMSIIQPYTTVNYLICLQGIYPSRN